MISNGDVVHRPLVQSTVTLLSTLSSQTHSDIFVAPFLAATKDYYEAEGNRLAQELEPSDYLKRVNRRLHEEAERCDLVVGSSMKGSVLRTVLDAMVLIHVEAIVEKGNSNDMSMHCRQTEVSRSCSFHSSGTDDKRQQRGRPEQRLPTIVPC